MTIPTSPSEAAHREEERLEEWLGHPERRAEMDDGDHLVSAADARGTVAVKQRGAGALSTLYRVFFSVLKGA